MLGFLPGSPGGRTGYQTLQGLRQLRTAVLKFILMMERKSAQEPLAFGQQFDQHLATVGISTVPGNQFRTFQAVNQFDRAVMFQLHPLGDVANGWAQILRKPLDSEQQLMLLGFNAGVAGGHLAEMKKASNLVSEFGQGAIVELLNRLHFCIVTR